jgi:hypothetical protein
MDIGSQLQQEDSATGSSTTAASTPDIVVYVQQYQQCRACVLRVCSRQRRISCFVCFVRAASCSVVQSLLCFVCFAQPSTSALLSCSRLRCCQLSCVTCVVIRVLLEVSCFVCGICAACTSDGEQGRGGCDVVLPAACVRCCPLMRNMRVVCNGVESLSRSCILSVAKQGQGQILLIQRRLVLVQCDCDCFHHDVCRVLTLCIAAPRLGTIATRSSVYIPAAYRTCLFLPIIFCCPRMISRLF